MGAPTDFQRSIEQRQCVLCPDWQVTCRELWAADVLCHFTLKHPDLLPFLARKAMIDGAIETERERVIGLVVEEAGRYSRQREDLIPAEIAVVFANAVVSKARVSTER